MDRSGPLVPAGASTALLCEYPLPPNEAPGGYPLGRQVPLAPERIPDLLSYLNGLEPMDPAAGACTLIGRAQYQVAIGYPDDTSAVVRLEVNCGTVSYAGATRRVNSMRSLLDRWPGR